MLTLYHAPQTRSSRIIWLLEELGADYDIVFCDIPRMDGSGSPDPANPHPDKKVPALVHDGALITESVAIALYLTDLYPEAGLGPPVGHADRGPYLSWLAYYAGVVEPVLTLGFFDLGDHEGLRRTFRGRAELDRRVLDALTRGPYMVGDSFTAADIMFASIGLFMRQGLPEGETVDGYIARCGARPALAADNGKDMP